MVEECGKFAASFGKMRRDKLYAFGMVALFGWMIMTYILFTHQPPIFDSKFTRSYPKRIESKAFSKLNENIDRFSIRLKQQIQDSDKLLLELQEIVATRRKTEKVPAKVKDEVITTKFTLENPDDTVIPILMFACNRVTVSKAIEPLLQYRGDNPARKSKFPIIVSQVGSLRYAY